MRRGIALVLAVLGCGFATALLTGCADRPTKQEVDSVDYGPYPENYERLVRDHLKARLTDPAAAIIEFRTEPKRLYQQGSALRPLQYGWAVCLFVNDKNKDGDYEGFHPIVYLIHSGKVIAVNGGAQDNIIGWQFARDGCKKLGVPFSN
jgi:hypothetical protein